MSNRPRTRRSPGQQTRRDHLIYATSGWPDKPAAETPPPSLSAATRMVLDQHRAEAGQCARCGTQWPCDTAIHAGTEGGAG